MGLACSQIRLLTLTARKADCEYGISVDSMHKMALTREMSELSSEYYSRLKAKNICYYANGQYNAINYNYLMGYGINYLPITSGTSPLKTDNSMVLTDYNGLTVLSNDYAKAIISVLGSGAMDAKGRGTTFSSEHLARIMAAIEHSPVDAATYQKVIEGGQVDASFAANIINTLSGSITGQTQANITEEATNYVKKLVDFYKPIFLSAANNGWTTEYNKDMAVNDNYISDAINSGTMRLTSVNEYGDFDPDANLTYFVTAGLVESRNDSDVREEITAWYNAEKERITEKENLLDIHMGDLSTELEAINTEIQSIQSLIDDAISSVFDWGNG